MAAIEKPAIPKGSTVLVTGANGFIGSHVADQFLHHGYKVRATVRDARKCAWLQKLFDEKYGQGLFELVSVPDMTAAGAHDEAVKGVSAVAHTASPATFDPDPNNIIPPSIAGALGALGSAYAEPAVKRFVMTSSSFVALPADPARWTGAVLTEDSWNEDAAGMAWAPPPYEPARAVAVYTASKVASEQEVWKYHRENRDRRPDLVVNTILPDFNLGKILDPANQGRPSTAGLITPLWNGVSFPAHMCRPQYFVDVQDTARLHVAGAVHPDARGERIFGYAEVLVWDEVLAILRRQNPGRRLADDFSRLECGDDVRPRARAEQLLRDLGRPGWTSLEDSLWATTEDLRAAAS